MKKFTSRKFLLALLGDVMGIVTMFVGKNTATTIAGAAAVILVNVVYCIVEGCIDAKSIGQITDAVEDIAEELGASEQTVEAINQIGFIVEDAVSDK